GGGIGQPLGDGCEVFTTAHQSVEKHDQSRAAFHDFGMDAGVRFRAVQHVSQPNDFLRVWVDWVGTQPGFGKASWISPLFVAVAGVVDDPDAEESSGDESANGPDQDAAYSRAV